ncbi:MAG: hypothetical protein GY740_14985 [Gammaproteobacteria bacterium]|nr:hypothetical protein [Gammaproteobacteria bacterium]
MARLAARCQLQDFPDATLLLYAAVVRPRPMSHWHNNPTDFNLDDTPFTRWRDPELNSMTYAGGTQNHKDMLGIEKVIHNEMAELRKKADDDSEVGKAGPHPVDTHTLFTNWKKNDYLGIGSTIYASDFMVTIEFYRLENWAFNRTQLHPQFARYHWFTAPAISDEERESLKLEQMRYGFDLDAYKALHPETTHDMDKMDNWPADELDKYVSERLEPPVRDAKGLDLNQQFQDLVAYRKLANSMANRNPNYDMTADTMSPYMPPQCHQLLKNMPFGHLSLLMLRATMHTHTPIRSTGIHTFVQNFEELIDGLNGLLASLEFGFDSQMFVLHPMDVNDYVPGVKEELIEFLVAANVWHKQASASTQLLGLTVGNLRGEYVTALLEQWACVPRDKTRHLPAAFQLFFTNNIFFVWNRSRMQKYFKDHFDFEIKGNFISIEGLLQLQNIHIGNFLRTVATSDTELEEMVQLITGSQNLASFSGVRSKLYNELSNIADTTALSANMVVHLLLAVVQLMTPTTETCSDLICNQIEQLILQMKVDPTSLLIVQSQPNMKKYKKLLSKAKMPAFHEDKMKEIAQLIMMGRKSNREQFLLGTVSDMVCDYMLSVNEELNTERNQKKFKFEERVTLRAKLLLVFRRAILRNCALARQCGHYNHPSTYKIGEAEDIVQSDGSVSPTASAQLVTVLLRERYLDTRIQLAVYLNSMQKIRNLIALNLFPAHDHGYYRWSENKVERHNTWDPKDQLYKSLRTLTQ